MDNSESNKVEKIENKQPQFVFGNCFQCKHQIQMPFPPIVAMGNQTVSMVGIPHTLGINCNNCGLYHNIAIQQCQVELILVPMEKPLDLNEEKQIVPIHSFPNLKSIKGN